MDTTERRIASSISIFAAVAFGGLSLATGAQPPYLVAIASAVVASLVYLYFILGVNLDR